MNKSSFSPRPSDSVHRPSKRFGQNFLTDRNTINRIIDAVAPTTQGTIVEIGPGKGALTNFLLEKAGRLVAIEFDRQLIPLLTEQFANKPNFNLIQSDALVTDICAAISPATKARVVANLPYNISTAILQRLIEQRSCLTDMTLMLQRRWSSESLPQPEMLNVVTFRSLLKRIAKRKVFDVAPTAFKPAPKVWSSVVRLAFRPSIAADVKDESLLWQIVSAGFAQRRKTILNNLRSAASPLQERPKRCGGASIVLCRAEVDLQRRAETLTLEEWVRITRAVE